MSLTGVLRTALERDDPTGLCPEKPRATHTLDYAIWRFLNTWCQDRILGADHAVLVRQIARWQGGRLFVGSLPPALARYADRAGFGVTPAGELIATPFAPTWLGADLINADEGIDARPVMRRRPEEFPAEPYLKSLGYGHWQSRAQKEAAWASLTAPPGSTTLVALPTGSGKSLCFQVLSRFGTGLTVVVVPTVALAIDQWRSAREVLGHIPDLNPHYFASDDRNLDPNTVVNDVREGRTRLVFTSPEACVSGRLRYVLEDAARKHQLENLVVDEAHIIESWGAYFRVDFQMLSTLRRNWLQLSEGTLRTFLLSATFTPQSRQVLQNLFGAGGEWREFISQRLRPEMIYYAYKFTSEEARKQAVLECAWRLPRPAIYYTTEVKEAKELASTLSHEEGFSRVACFHGETRAAERRSLLTRWRADQIDVMVATSAFGLGVDKADVRTVVHACMPENMHRYYQEVGRGGRDGASSVSILLPTKRDKEVAEGLAPRLLSEDIAQKRWESLWQTREAVSADDHVWKLNPGARRTGLLGTRTWNENVRWNKRLILQLLRAGKLDLLDVEYHKETAEADPMEWVKVKIKFSPSSPRVGSSIAKQREAELETASQGLKQISNYLDGQRPICRILQKLYGRETQRVCGGCPVCRREGRDFNLCPLLEFKIGPPGAPKRAVVTDVPNPLLKGGFDILYRKVRQMVRHKQIRRFACAPLYFGLMNDLFTKAFNESDTDLYRLDPLPSEPPFNVSPDEAVIFFHMGQLTPEALSLELGREVVHMICAGVDYLDFNGRHPGESDGWALYPSLDYWM